MRLAAIGVIAAAVVGGGAVGALPMSSPVTMRPAADIVDAGKLYNSAQKKFAAGQVTEGLTDLAAAVKAIGNDADSLALQAIWSDQVDDTATRDSALGKLSTLNAAAAATARNAIAGIAAAAALVPDTAPESAGAKTAIVVSGSGAGAAELVKRAAAARSQAGVAATSPIVVSGTAGEVAAIRKWLVSNGIAPRRITVDDKAPSVVVSAQNVAGLLSGRGLSDVVLVSSPSEIRRAAADFATTGLTVAATVTTATQLAQYRTPLARDQQQSLRLEATRAAKIPATKAEGIQLPGGLPDTGPGLLTDIGGKILGSLMTGSKG